MRNATRKKQSEQREFLRLVECKRELRDALRGWSPGFYVPGVGTVGFAKPLRIHLIAADLVYFNRARQFFCVHTFGPFGVVRLREEHRP